MRSRGPAHCLCYTCPLPRKPPSPFSTEYFQTMANIQPVTFAKYGKKRWQHFSSYAFAARTALVPLMLTEVRNAASAFPIGFAKHQNNCFPVAILGLEAETNVFVDEQGQWLGAYTPAAFRAWPFSVSYAERGEKLLCVDEDSGLITDPPDGEAFFNEDETLSEALQGVMHFLARFTQDRAPSLGACAALEAAGLLQPWTATVRTDRRQWTMDQFLRIDEEALNKLGTSTLASLHKVGAISLAYSQLHSMAHLPLVGRLAEQRLSQADARAETVSPGA
ncbi:SAPC family protein [Aromatoleum aromaticum EbN1]|uniref:SAPC family protein n=2 Tax=Aromatoleum aromaticum TaxID=551760 RepID=Q5P6S6_AROAE|nr:SAPC family protein [Aromatoleum aromaticum EbN1]